MQSPVSNVGHLVERECFLRVALMAVVTEVSIGVHVMWPRGSPPLSLLRTAAVNSPQPDLYVRGWELAFILFAGARFRYPYGALFLPWWDLIGLWDFCVVQSTALYMFLSRLLFLGGRAVAWASLDPMVLFACGCGTESLRRSLWR